MGKNAMEWQEQTAFDGKKVRKERVIDKNTL